MKDYITISCTPYEESCAQVGSENYYERAMVECKKFKDLIRKKLGKEPIGAELKIKGFPHDFGTYYKVVCEYEDTIEEAVNYAFKCEYDAPQTWDDC